MDQKQIVHSGMVATGSGGLSAAIVIVFVWVLSLVHITVPDNVGLALGVIFTAMIGLVLHRNLGAPDAPAADTSGAKVAAPDAPKAAVADVAKAALIFLFIFLPLVLVACAQQPPAATLAQVCDGIGTGYETAAGYAAQHKLSPQSIATLAELEPTAIELCDPANPPADQQSAINSASDLLRQIGLINAGVH